MKIFTFLVLYLIFHIFFSFFFQKLPKVNAALAGRLQDQDEEEKKTKKPAEKVSVMMGEGMEFGKLSFQVNIPGEIVKKYLGRY